MGRSKSTKDYRWYVFNNGLTISGENSSRLVQLNDCTCLGFTQTFECTVFGGGVTIWNSSAFDCIRNSIQLRHSKFIGSQATGECNDGAVVASSVESSDNCYTSLLNITITPEMLNESLIVCAHRNNIKSSATMVVGQILLEITTGMCT